MQRILIGGQDSAPECPPPAKERSFGVTDPPTSRTLTFAPAGAPPPSVRWAAPLNPIENQPMKHLITATVLLGAGTLVACNSNKPADEPQETAYEVEEVSTVSVNLTGMT